MPLDTTVKGRTAHEAAWWEAWRQLDLSWDGLARRDGHQGTLQDYWRNEAGQLILEPGTGRRWTRYHCPFNFADGTPSPKVLWTASEWRDLHNSLRTRLAMGTADKPSLLTGVVLDGLWEPEVEVPDAEGFLYLRANWAYFRDGVDFSRNGMGLADFRAAWFGSKAVFEGARAVSSDFDGALFADRMIQAATFAPSSLRAPSPTAVEPVRVSPEPVFEPEVPARPGIWRIIAGVATLAVIAGIAWAAAHA